MVIDDGKCNTDLNKINIIANTLVTLAETIVNADKGISLYGTKLKIIFDRVYGLVAFLHDENERGWRYLHEMMWVIII